MKGRQKSQSIVKHIYIPLRQSYKSHKGLAERLVRKRLEKKGWTTWRGGYIYATRFEDIYPNVARKYTKLVRLLGTKAEYLQYLCVVHHGMPDLICYKNGYFKFVECKLGHEQLNNLQKKCIPRLQAMGFLVEVHKVVFQCTKLREAFVDIKSNDKFVVEKQERLRLRY